ncbi:hypothetical protein GQ43DRAFT_476580 [Delitschia confertaspora ATCC 74209]|uniref:Uncharacterized protein n=1 Tax=Delitschia confertaspora ATCC 74209 TaxID=1513339 RepID=A0A9P4JAW7_9PLEO|nr:hypothetical protein GQ43DRAFT_476580 [Delitschia confertaspora ATCC 74209]
MQFTTILLGLAASVSAIDIRLRAGSGCTGSYQACTGINPDTCCGKSNYRFTSVGYVAIPTDWRIQARAYSNGDCSNLVGLQTIQRTTNACINEPNSFATLSGGGYNFLNPNKRRTPIPMEQCDAGRACKFVAEPDTLVLEDDTKVDLATNGTTVENIPQEFKAYEKIEG